MAAKPGRKPAMSVAEKKALKAEMGGLLKRLAEVRLMKTEVLAAESAAAKDIHEKIGGVSFRYKGEMLQVVKTSTKDDAGNVTAETFKIRALAEKRVLDF